MKNQENKMETLNILMLYPEVMNIYGDMGNLDFISYYGENCGIKVNKIFYNLGDDFTKILKDPSTSPDIILGGGGQDSSQSKIEEDLKNIKFDLKKLADKNIPMLMICGLYQLFGTKFITSEKKIIKGVGIFDIETISGEKRIIGNQKIISPNQKIGTEIIYGFENHSGKTYFLNDDTKPLGVVSFKTGGNTGGNNGEDGFEGAVKNNVIGSYLHGPILPKNPELCEFLINAAFKNKYNKQISFENQKIQDIKSLIYSARDVAKTLQR